MWKMAQFMQLYGFVRCDDEKNNFTSTKKLDYFCQHTEVKLSLLLGSILLISFSRHCDVVTLLQASHNDA